MLIFDRLCNFYIIPVMTYDNENYWRERRTIRKYSGREVSDEMLRDIIESASHAPTTGNMQLYSVVISRDRDMLASLAPAHFNQPAATGAPVLLTFCADFNRFCHWCDISDADHGYDNFQSFMTAVIDTVIFTQQFVTIAERRGLGCCYLGTTTYNTPTIASVLQLPERVIPVCTISVGWPADESAVSDRLPVRAIIHHERYTAPDDAEIAGYYAYKESLPESAGFIAENGKTTLAQVFTDIRYTRKNNEYFSRLYYDFIETHGFPFPK